MTDLVDRLKDPSLLVTKALLGSEWVDRAHSGKRFDVTNPSTGDVVANLPDLGAEETQTAIDAAFAAQKSWAAKTGKERAGVLRDWHDLMIAHADDLAAILCAEMGKPLPEAQGRNPLWRKLP